MYVYMYVLRISNWHVDKSIIIYTYIYVYNPTVVEGATMAPGDWGST